MQTTERSLVYASVSSYFARQAVHRLLLKGSVTSFDTDGKRLSLYHAFGSTLRVTEGLGNNVEINPYPDSDDVKKQIQTLLRDGNLSDGTSCKMDVDVYDSLSFKDSQRLADRRKKLIEYGDHHGVLIARHEQARPFSMDDIYHIDGNTVRIAGSDTYYHVVPRKLEVIVFGDQPAGLLRILHKL